MFSINLSIILFLSIILAHSTEQLKFEPTWKSLDSRPLPQWYDDSKFGIFLHWGVFSVPSFPIWFWYKRDSKHYNDFLAKNFRQNFTYADFGPQFKAEWFDPNHWSEVFRSAGAKYVVLTTKHHDGYCLWPSKYSKNWNAMDVGPNRDLVGDLANAVRGSGLHFGVYHSLYEWFNPIYLSDKASNFTTNTFVTTKSRRELEELVNNYKPDVIFSDGDWEASAEYWQSKEFLAWLYNDSPVKDSVVVNDRWGGGISCQHGDYWNCEDKYNPGKLISHKWENAMTVHKWAWTYMKEAQIQDFYSTHDLITNLTTTVSCGGNLLLNVGPTPDGRIDPIFEERLRDIGQWLKVNGEAIYGTKPWTHQNDTIAKDVWYTRKESAVYSIVLSWPQNDVLELGSVIYSTVRSVQLLGITAGDLPVSEGTGGRTVVKFPRLYPDTLRWAYVLKIQTK